MRFAETDAQGVAHNSVYLVWFEVARIDYLARFRGGYPGLRDRRDRGADDRVARALPRPGALRRPAGRARPLRRAPRRPFPFRLLGRARRRRRSPTAGRARLRRRGTLPARRASPAWLARDRYRGGVTPRRRSAPLRPARPASAPASSASASASSRRGRPRLAAVGRVPRVVVEQLAGARVDRGGRSSSSKARRSPRPTCSPS